MPLELVLSEDGSTDSTENIIERLSEKIPLKAILSTSRKGYDSGIKEGLKLVKVVYIQFPCVFFNSKARQDWISKIGM